MTVQAVGDAFNNGFYEEQVKLRSLPLLDSRPQRFMRTLAAKDAISTRKV
jgi:chloride channel 7